MPELDALRGVAILLVVSFHFFSQLDERTLAPGWGIAYAVTRVGWAGVTLFFVLSGFLITGILLDRKQAPDYFQRFYTSRVLRIAPALFASLVLYWCTNTMSARDIMISLLSLGNFAPRLNMPVTPYWSLGVEEQFYLVWPLVVLRLKEATLKNTVVALIVTAVAGRVATWMAYGGFNLSMQFDTWCVTDGLALGALLALVVRENNDNPAAVRMFARNLLLFATGSVLFFFRFGVLRGATFAGSIFRLTLVGIVFTAVLAYALVHGSEGRTLPAAKVLTFFGYISYGLYLVHWPIFVLTDRLIQAVFPGLGTDHGMYPAILLRVLIGGGGAVLVAYLSRRYFEAPFLRFKPGVSPRKQDLPALSPEAAP